MKYVANLLVAIHNVASAEALVLGMKAGLPPELVYEQVKVGAGNSRVFELRGPMMVKGRYDDPTMKVSTWQKDMEVIGSFAQSLGVPTPSVLRDAADLRRRDVDRLRHAGYGIHLRRARSDGGDQARQGASKTPARPGAVRSRRQQCGNFPLRIRYG